MPTVSRGLPARPHLDVPKRQARELLADWRAAVPEAFDRIRGRHPRFKDASDTVIAAGPFRLSDAHLVIAREYTYATWPALKRRIELNAFSHDLAAALHDGGADTIVRILREHPDLLHLPVRGGNWGPPMSYAANLGRLDVVQAISALGARDHQHAFDRALLQGAIDCARWLHAHGATLPPGIVMGSCETLKIAGLRFLAEAGAPFTNEHGDRLAPLALVLETYARNPAGKHEILELFAQRGYAWPDTPLMAFHRGRPDLLQKHLERDPTLLARRFACRDLYPAELGCADDGHSGMHGTPLDGATLLHLAIDFDEQEIFDWCLARGTDVDAPARIDAEGFGGQTPLFHCLVNTAVSNGRQRDARMTRTLLERGASPQRRASLRKFLDWRDEPGWHIARDVTPLEWARGFPEQRWVNDEALRLVAAAAGA